MANNGIADSLSRDSTALGAVAKQFRQSELASSQLGAIASMNAIFSSHDPRHRNSYLSGSTSFISEPDFSHNFHSKLQGSVVTDESSSLYKSFLVAWDKPEPTIRIKGLLAIFDRWQVTDFEAAILLGKEDAAAVMKLRQGTTELASRDAEDRARLLFQIHEGLFSLFRDKQAERNWMRARQQMLNEQSILETMLAGSIINLLTAKAFIDDLHGRYS